MCAEASTAKQMAQRVKPKFKKRNELTAYWVNKAMEHSGMTAAQLGAAYYEWMQKFNRNHDANPNKSIDYERMNFERYANINRDGSMDLKYLSNFVAWAREFGHLPKRGGVNHSSEILLTSKDPNKLISDAQELHKRVQAKRDALIKALTEYRECFEASDKSFYGFSVIDSRTAIPERELVPGEKWGEWEWIEYDDYPEVHVSRITDFLDFVEANVIRIFDPLDRG